MFFIVSSLRPIQRVLPEQTRTSLYLMTMTETITITETVVIVKVVMATISGNKTITSVKNLSVKVDLYW